MFHFESMRIRDCTLWFNIGARRRISYNLCQEQKYRSFYVTNCGSLHVAYLIPSKNIRRVKFSHFTSLRLYHA